MGVARGGDGTEPHGARGGEGEDDYVLETIVIAALVLLWLILSKLHAVFNALQAIVKEADRQNHEMNAMYPVFVRGQLRIVAGQLEELSRKYSDLREELQEANRAAHAGEGQREDYYDLLFKFYYAEFEYDSHLRYYRHMLESNAAVMSGRKKIRQIKSPLDPLKMFHPLRRAAQKKADNIKRLVNSPGTR